MDFESLWNKIDVEPDNLELIKKDWSEGIVPELPYEIIGQQNLKNHISERLEKIDGEKMQNTVIAAQYGDGKTNVLKYLSLYFRINPKYNIKLLYSRADVDKTDICLNLLQMIQDHLLTDLLNCIKELRQNPDFKIESLAYKFDENFGSVKEYVDKLFEKNNSDVDLKYLIYLGTGRLYSKGAFAKINLPTLTDFNRREILVILLNILAQCGKYVIFAIDELEKIHDKSPRRMAYFFSSFRELTDLFNKIHGHYLILTITNAINIEELSEPLFGRIRKDIIKLEKLQDIEDLKSLITLIASLLDFNISDVQIKKLASSIKRGNYKSIRYIIQEINRRLNENSSEVFEDVLKIDPEVEVLYDYEMTIASHDGIKNLSRSFFDPLQYYLESLNYSGLKENILRRDYQAVIDPFSNTAFFFLFNDESKIKSRIEEFVAERNIRDFVVFVPNNLNVSYATLGLGSLNIKIIEYDPLQLFVLLNLYRTNYDKQEILFKLIGIVTQNVFE